MTRIELHNESAISRPRSLITPWEIVSESKKSDCATIAFTDYNSVEAYGISEYECHRAGLQMIYGITMNCIDRDDRYDIVLLAKNLVGRDNIFRLLELMHGNASPYGSAITRSQLDAHREGLLIGAASQNGQLVRALQLRKSSRYIERIIQSYDYLEFESEPYDLSAEIYRLAKKHEIPLCAVQHCALSHSANKYDKAAYETIMKYEGHTLSRYLTHMTEEELLQEIDALYTLPHERGLSEKAVCDDPMKIVSTIGSIPKLSQYMEEGHEAWNDNAISLLQGLLSTTLHKRYGEHCPAQVQTRIETELRIIEKTHTAQVFLLLAELAQRAGNGKMILCGEVGNMEVLFLLGLCEHDPMPRHIWCEHCGHWGDVTHPYGAHLICPKCGANVTAFGLGLPVEAIEQHLRDGTCFELRLSKDTLVALRDGVPYKSNAVILESSPMLIQLGSRHKAQCIADFAKDANLVNGTVAYEKLLQAIQHNLPQNGDNNPFIQWHLCSPDIKQNLTHLPTKEINANYYRLYFCPEFSTKNSCIRFLPHTGLALLEACEAMTGIPIQSIPLDDPRVIAQITKVNEDFALYNTLPGKACRHFGLSMFEVKKHGTDGDSPAWDKLFRLMPFKNVDDLARISSLMHSTGAWEGNGEYLVESGSIDARKIIACREDVFAYLTKKGMDHPSANALMYYICMGRAKRSSPDLIRGFLPPQWKQLCACGADDWFIESCQKISYLFPRSHNVQLAMSAMRLVWYTIYYPEQAKEAFEQVLAENDNN